MQRLALRVTLCAFALTFTTAASADDLLTVGSKAPAIDIEHYVTDGDGKFKPVNEFDKGTVYIVEFWATWCGPCIASMPHLASLQEEYADKGVRLISVSDEDLETVEKFLERKLPEATAKKTGFETYGELCSQYTLTTDPDESVNKAYMRAAHQNGIPTAFIVGKTGEIEYIGHPMSMDEALAAIVDGSWDRTEHAAEVLAEQKQSVVESQVSTLLRSGKTDEALALVEKELESADGEFKSTLTQLRFQLLMSSQPEVAAKELPKLLETADAELVANLLRTLATADLNDEQKATMVDAVIAKIPAAVKETEDDRSKALLYFGSAQALVAVGRFDEALQYTQTAQEEVAEFKAVFSRLQKQIELQQAASQKDSSEEDKDE